MRRLALLALIATAACGRGPATPPAQPDAPRAAVELLVERYSRAGKRSFYTMSPDGSRVLPFDAAGPDALLVAPAPDGRTLAVLRPSNGLVHLWLVDRDSGRTWPVLEGERALHSVSWSADGRQLAVGQTTATEVQDIWVLNRDGSGARDLTPDPLPGVYLDSTPVFSPDGTRIAFASNRNGLTQIFVMNADGTGVAPLVPPPTLVRGTDPAWSPDGRLVAFAAATPGTIGIGVIRPDGGDYRFFPFAGDVGRVAWSPDGRVLFSTNTTGDYEIHALEPVSGATVNLTNHLAHDYRVARIPYVRPSPWRGFAAPVRYPAGASGSPAIAVGDVVADAVPDIVALAPGTSQVRVLPGSGGGDFGTASGLDAAAGLGELLAVDLGNDGLGDLVALGPSSLSVWRGGAGGLGAPAEYPIGGDARGLAVADLDDDGSPDLAVAYDRPGTGFHVLVHSVRPADGALIGVLDAATPYPGAGHAAACDVTGEGNADLVVLTGHPEASAVLLAGHGDITLAVATVAATGLTLDRDTVPLCADLDGDRRGDLILLQPGAPDGLRLLRSSGSGFTPPESLGAGGTSVVAADVDRDGDLDLLVADPSRPDVLFLRNLGDGQFARPVSVPVGGAPLRLAAADLDLDGWPDLVVADAGGSVAVLRNLGRAQP